MLIRIDEQFDLSTEEIKVAQLIQRTLNEISDDFEVHMHAYKTGSTNHSDFTFHSTISHLLTGSLVSFIYTPWDLQVEFSHTTLECEDFDDMISSWGRIRSLIRFAFHRALKAIYCEAVLPADQQTLVRKTLIELFPMHAPPQLHQSTLTT